MKTPDLYFACGSRPSDFGRSFLAVLVGAGLLSMGLVPALRAEHRLDEFTSRAWDQSRERLAEIVGLEIRKASLPAKKWFGFDQRDADERINELLDEVIEALEFTAIGNWRQQYGELGQRIKEAEERIAQLREEQMAAPIESSFNPFAKSRKDYEKKIRSLRESIADLEAQQEELVGRLQEEYEKIGIQLSREQVRFYLASVSGKDIVSLSAVFHNVKELNFRLEEILRESPDNTAMSRRYYGVHVALIKALVRAHELVLDRIEHRYLPRLSELSTENKAISQQTSRLLQNSSESEKSILRASLEAQEATEQALSLYRQHLRNLSEHVRNGHQALARRYQIANNAYQTIRIASSLANEMEACIADLTALQEMHLPDLLPIESDVVEKKFSEITARIQM